MSNSYKILIANDDPHDHDLHKEMRNEMRIVCYKSIHIINFTSLRNGDETLDYLTRKGTYQYTSISLPDFIMLDLNTPLIEGLRVLQEIKKNISTKKIPVFVMTNNHEHNHKVECETLGCDGYFTKGGRLSELKVLIHRMFNASLEI